MKQDILSKIKELLFEHQDLSYKQFHSSLVPNINPDSIIGVRTPELKKLASALLKDKDFVRDKLPIFLNSLPHEYYEQNFLHALFISKEKDFDKAICEIEKFLPYIDNWAVCDCFSPVCFKNNMDALWERIECWLESDKTYTVRFGIVNAMRYFLDDMFSVDRLEKVMSVKSKEYYVNMALAWYFSFALIKQYDIAISYLENKTFDKWIHNKSIQKARESFRISQDKKDYLKSLKIHE